MGDYIFKRKEGDGAWTNNSNSIKDAEDAAIEIATEIQNEIRQGKAVFVIIFAVPNTEVSRLEDALKKIMVDFKDYIEFIIERETCNCTDVILKTTLQDGVIPFVKILINENKLETIRDNIQGALEKELKKNVIFILPYNFPQKNDDSQESLENFILFWAGILERKLIMFQCKKKEEAVKQCLALFDQQDLHLQDMLDERDNLQKETFNKAAIIDEIIETHDIQMTEEHGIEDKIIDNDDAIGKENIEYAER